VFPDRAPARDRTHHSRETCMLGRHIDMLRCVQCRYHVCDYWVFPSTCSEHRCSSFLSSRSTLKLISDDRAKLMIYTDNTMGHRRDLDHSPDNNTRNPSDPSVQGITDSLEQET
jgi:hypothetical protein